MAKAALKKRPVVTAPIRIMVVAGLAERRADIIRWLDDKMDLAVVVAHRDAAAAVADLGRTAPDVIVIDPETAAQGFAEFATLTVRRPELPVLMVRADGSPGSPVERFGQWHDGSSGRAARRLSDVGAELVAAIRLIVAGPAAEFGQSAPESRSASLVH